MSTPAPPAEDPPARYRVPMAAGVAKVLPPPPTSRGQKCRSSRFRSLAPPHQRSRDHTRPADVTGATR